MPARVRALIGHDGFWGPRWFIDRTERTWRKVNCLTRMHTEKQPDYTDLPSHQAPTQHHLAESDFVALKIRWRVFAPEAVPVQIQ